MRFLDRVVLFYQMWLQSIKKFWSYIGTHVPVGPDDDTRSANIFLYHGVPGLHNVGGITVYSSLLII